MLHYLIIDSSEFGDTYVYDFDDAVVFNKAAFHYKGIRFVYDLVDLLNSQLPECSCLILNDDDFEVFNRKINDDADYHLFYCHELDAFLDLMHKVSRRYLDGYIDSMHDEGSKNA